MAKYHIVQAAPGWFQEIAETVLYGLRGLGHEAALSSQLSAHGQNINIILGAHLLELDAIPVGSIVYNFEQLGGAILRPEHDRWGERATVWDYSAGNVRSWQMRGVAARLVPLGYVPELARIPDFGNDIDVLFYGSMNHRRHQVLAALEALGLRATVVSGGVFGARRDAWIARAKVVLNVHYYESKIFEIARVSYLLANRKAVVTEQSSDEADYAYLDGGLVSVPYSALPETCRGLLGDRERREKIRAAGFEQFSRRSESEILRAALSTQRSAVS